MTKEKVPSDIVGLVKDGRKKKTGYAALTKKSMLFEDYLSRWDRFFSHETSSKPLLSYRDFLKTKYSGNLRAAAKILASAKKDYLQRLDDLKKEFNLLISEGRPEKYEVRAYCRMMQNVFI